MSLKSISNDITVSNLVNKLFKPSLRFYRSGESVETLTSVSDCVAEPWFVCLEQKKNLHLVSRFL